MIFPTKPDAYEFVQSISQIFPQSRTLYSPVHDRQVYTYAHLSTSDNQVRFAITSNDEVQEYFVNRACRDLTSILQDADKRRLDQPESQLDNPASSVATDSFAEVPIGIGRK